MDDRVLFKSDDVWKKTDTVQLKRNEGGRGLVGRSRLFSKPELAPYIASNSLYLCIVDTYTGDMSRNGIRGVHIRELGRLETMYHTYYQQGMDVCVQMARLQCTQCVTLTEVHRAIKILCCNHPVLRMFIQEEENNRFHFVEMNPLKTNCTVSYLSTEDLLQNEVCKEFPSDGPLWRITVQRTESDFHRKDSLCHTCQSPNNDNFLHTFSFAFSFHHSLVDGMYLSCVLSDFIKFLDMVQLKDTLLLKCTDKKQMLPAFEQCLVPLAVKDKQTLVPVRCETETSLDALTEYKRFFQNEIVPLRLKPTKTKAVRLSMDETKTSQFLSDCKKQHILVSGAITAAACIAFAKQVATHTPPKAKILLIPVDIMVDMRRYLTQTFRDLPGTAAIHLPFLVRIPLQENLHSGTLFWEIAKRCSKELSDAIHSTKPVNYLREEVENEIQSVKEEGLGKSPYVLCISNLTNVDSIVRPEQKPRFQLMGYPALSSVGIHNSPIFEIVLFSLMNQLHIHTFYCCQYTSDETASRFSWEMTKTFNRSSKL